MGRKCRVFKIQGVNGGEVIKRVFFIENELRYAKIQQQKKLNFSMLNQK